MLNTTLVGDWRVVIQSRDAAWSQRVVVKNAAGGLHVLNGNVGLHFDVQGDGVTPWQLGIEHNDGSGWTPSDLRLDPRQITGSLIMQVIRSEDVPVGGDADYNDLIVRVEKLGMVDQPSCPFAVRPSTMQVMPEGIFEASLGRYFLAVTVRNVWTETWPVQTAVGLTARCRSWLHAGGMIIDDAWSVNDLAAVGQEVVGGRVRVGPLSPWQTRVIYFKVDVSGAQVRKHNVEVEVLEPTAEELDHLNRKAIAPMSVSRTTFDATKKVFVSTCDHGSMTVAIKELTVDYHTFKRAVGCARELFRPGVSGSGNTQAGNSVAKSKQACCWSHRKAWNLCGICRVFCSFFKRLAGYACGLFHSCCGSHEGCKDDCSQAERERLRRRLLAFLDGKDEDICGIWRDLQRCCGGGRHGKGGEDWTQPENGCLAMFAFPTLVEYRVDYAPGFVGQYGPIPFDDPWWKVLLAIIAIILSIAAAVSAAADLADRSDDVVIGQVERTILDAFKNQSDIPSGITRATPGSVDAAVVKLNGKRGQTSAIFSYKDAASGEDNTTPIIALDGVIDTAGTALTNAEIDQLFQNLADNPGDPGAQAAMQVFKSGARSGTTLALIGSFIPQMPRGPEEDGSTVIFVNQISFVADPVAPTQISRGGDSGSLWLQRNPPHSIIAINHAGDDPGTTAFGCRIEDVMNALNIRFS